MTVNRVGLVMADSIDKGGGPETLPEHKDRSVGLVVFGAVSVLIGLFCALLIPLTFLSVALSESVGGGVDLGSAWGASAIYGVIAVALVWLGIGSMRARRWACELLLSFSWIWLVTGICSLIVGILVVPGMVAQLGAGSALPPETAVLMMAVTFGVSGVIYVVLPGLFVLFYRSPSVTATCRVRHPDPQWIDHIPRRLLTLIVVWVLLAASVLVMPGYNFLFPFFGLVLTGVAGAFSWTVVLAVCVALAVGTSRRAPWAWWGGVALTVVATLSSILTVLRFDMMEIMALMGLPEDQAAMMKALPMLDGWIPVLGSLVVWGTFLAYLMTLRRYFLPEATEGDV
jgi:MFS family permease